MKEKNNSNKIMIPIRIPSEQYEKIRKLVFNKKNKNRGYSINKYILELIEKNLKDNK